MQISILRILTLLVLGFSSLTANAAPPFARPVENLEEALQQAAGEHKLFTLMLEQDDCGACARLKQSIQEHRRTGAEFERLFVTAHVNLSTDPQIMTPERRHVPAIQWAYGQGIVGTPGWLFFNADGELLYRQNGGIANAATLLALGRYVSSAAYETLPFSHYLQQQGMAASAVHESGEHLH